MNATNDAPADLQQFAEAARAMIRDIGQALRLFGEALVRLRRDPEMQRLLRGLGRAYQTFEIARQLPDGDVILMCPSCFSRQIMRSIDITEETIECPACCHSIATLQAFEWQRAVRRYNASQMTEHHSRV